MPVFGDDEECGALLGEVDGKVTHRLRKQRYRPPLCTWQQGLLCIVLTAVLSLESISQYRAHYCSHISASTLEETIYHILNETKSKSQFQIPVDDSHSMDDDWESFREDYQQRFNKTVTPDSLRPWLRYAQKHQCNERDYYDGIETDLQVFRDIIVAQGNQKFRQEDIVAKGANQTSFYMVLQLQNHKWTMLDTVDYHKKGPLPLMKIEKQLQWLMEPVRAHRPAINNTFFFNLHDGARNKDSDRPIFSTCKQAYWTDDVAIPTDEEVVNLLVNDMTRFPFQQHNYQTYNGQV